MEGELNLQMWENKIKNQKGITLAALVVYISVMTIVIATVTVISTFFYDRIGDVVVTPKYAAEINKFMMFFAVLLYFSFLLVFIIFSYRYFSYKTCF